MQSAAFPIAKGVYHGSSEVCATRERHMPAQMSIMCPRVLSGYDVASLCHRCRSQHRTLDEMGRVHAQAASIAIVATVILNYVFFGLETARIHALKRLARQARSEMKPSAPRVVLNGYTEVIQKRRSRRSQFSRESWWSERGYD